VRPYRRVTKSTESLSDVYKSGTLRGSTDSGRLDGAGSIYSEDNVVIDTDWHNRRVPLCSDALVLLSGN
jgi:hypothetical protein